MRFALLLLPLLAACAPGTSPELAARNEARLSGFLEGLAPQAPQQCISRSRQYQLEVVGRQTLLFKSGRNLVYRADFPGGCGGLDPTRTIAYETVISDQICRGDAVRVIDRSTGSLAGSCAFPDFVPYVRPGSGVDPRRS